MKESRLAVRHTVAVSRECNSLGVSRESNTLAVSDLHTPAPYRYHTRDCSV